MPRLPKPLRRALNRVALPAARRIVDQTIGASNRRAIVQIARPKRSGRKKPRATSVASLSKPRLRRSDPASLNVASDQLLLRPSLGLAESIFPSRPGKNAYFRYISPRSKNVLFMTSTGVSLDTNGEGRAAVLLNPTSMQQHVATATFSGSSVTDWTWKVCDGENDIDDSVVRFRPVCSYAVFTANCKRDSQPGNISVKKFSLIGDPETTTNAPDQFGDRALITKQVVGNTLMSGVSLYTPIFTNTASWAAQSSATYGELSQAAAIFVDNATASSTNHYHVRLVVVYECECLPDTLLFQTASGDEIPSAGEYEAYIRLQQFIDSYHSGTIVAVDEAQAARIATSR